MNKELRNFAGGGMNGDDAIESIQVPDFVEGWNLRTTGTGDQEAAKVTNLESGEPITLPAPAGINKGLGFAGFPNVTKLYSFRFNSQGYHQLIEIDSDTNKATVLFTNLTDSNNIDILPLNAKSRIDDMVLVNDEYLCWTDGGTPHYTSIKALKNGDYRPVLEEDFSLIKPQPLRPIEGSYVSDTGRTSNLLYGKLFQFISQYGGFDYHYSAWSTVSKRILPQQESTPTVTTDLTKNNAIAVKVRIGNTRTKTIRVGARYDNLDWFVIKSVDRSYVTSLTNTAIDLSNEIYEAYSPADNTYTFLFYNDGLYEQIAATETDLAYDAVPRLAAAVTLVNDNILALGDITEGYDLPAPKVTFKAVSYQPDLQLAPVNTNTNPFRVSYVFPGAVGSGLGNHKRLMRVVFTGVPKTGDVWTIVLYDIRDASQTKTYSYTVKSAEDGNLDGVVGNSSPIIPWNSVISPRYSATETGFEFRGDPYYEVQSASVKLFNQGSGVTKSIRGLKSNSSYQAAISYRDKFGRYFPLVTGNDFIFKTASYAQTLGGSPALQWTIQEAAPAGAADYQILLSRNTSHQRTLFINGAVMNYKGQWDANTNNPTLAVNSGTVGDTYLIIQPKGADSKTNLGGNSTTYQSGDFVVYNGLSWDVVSKDFGDLSQSTDYLFFKINPLLLFNRKNSKVGDSVLNYQFSKGDRCTFNYYTEDNNTKNWFNSPTVDVQIEGFDPTTYLLKVRASSALNPSTISGKDVLMEIYTPLKRTDISDDNTDDNNATTVFYEIGERFTITNGKHDTLSGTITGGDIYYKSRELTSAVDPNKLYTFLVEDFNFSDFYISNYTSYGRARTVLDTMPTTERKAGIRYSDVYVLGSRNNGLTRFYPNRIYGSGDGETSSSYGAIRKMYQRGSVLMIFQETGIGYIPVFSTILEDQAEQRQLAVSDRLFNKIRYNNSEIGIGKGKSSFAVRNADCFFVDTNRAEPVRAGLDGVSVISGKMSKFFKQRIKAAVMAGYNVSGYYDTYYEEYVVVIETDGDVVQSLSFNSGAWKLLEGYTVSPGAINILIQPQHGSVNYNSSTGKATYTPQAGYSGNDVFSYTFNIGTTQIVKKECGVVTAGTTNVNQFYFNDVQNADTSTYYISNSVFVSGNNVPVPISIVGGEYSVNGGPWTTQSGMVNAGDDVRVRQMSSGSMSSTTSAVLTISDKSDSYDVSTGVLTASLTTTLNEQASPYADGNISVLVNGTEQIRSTGNETQTITINDGDVIKIASFVENPPEGVNAKQRLTVYIGSQVLYDQTADDVPGAGLEYTFTALSGNSYSATLTTTAGQYSYTRTESFDKQCGQNEYPSSVPYSKTYNSNISVEDAQLQAGNDPNYTSEGQSNANLYGTCTAPTYVNYNINEQANPYSDANLQVRVNNADVVVQEYTSNSGSVTLRPGNSIRFVAYSDNPSTGINATLRLQVTKNNVSVFDYTINNQSGGVNIFYDDNMSENDVFNVTVNSYADAGGGPYAYSVYAEPNSFSNGNGSSSCEISVADNTVYTSSPIDVGATVYKKSDYSERFFVDENPNNSMALHDVNTNMWYSVNNNSVVTNKGNC